MARENYHGVLNVTFDAMPTLTPKSIILPSDARFLDRLASATTKRRFYLTGDWKITVSGFKDNPKLNGTIHIPRKKDGKLIEFDGASVPLPWLVSVLSLGIMRPLGVMLVASIVHDYAFRYGQLMVEDNRTTQTVEVQRHEADALFRDIINSVNQLPLVGNVAWFAVRLGWLGIRYAGRRFTGKPPVMVILVGAAMALGLLYLLANQFATVVASLATAIFLLWTFTVAINRSKPPPR